MINKKELWLILNMKSIPCEFQHALLVADIDKKKIRSILRKTCAERRKIGLLKDVVRK